MSEKQRRFRCELREPNEGEEAYRLYIYDVISEESKKDHSSAMGFSQAIDRIPHGSMAEVRINSSGGDVFEGVAIYNRIKERKDLSTVGIVDGRAYSAASLILQACDTRIVPTGATVLIHNPMTMAIGNAEEMRKVAEELDKIAEGMRAIYMETTGLSEEELLDLMAAEKILTAEEAVKYGLADEPEEEPEEPEEAPEEEPTEEDQDGSETEEEEAEEEETETDEPEEEPEEPDEDKEPVDLSNDRYAAARRFFKFY